jgi:hypothetical protein
MTGYQSKKAAAQNKLTVDREQIEQWLEALKDIDALHHPAEPESADAQKAIADMGKVLEQQAQKPVAQCRADFEAWYASSSEAPNEPERTYELTDAGMSELTKSCIWLGWQAAHGIKEKNT